ncbi:MAG: YjjG family noncanonical pyrimidine nucleotidase [Clostridia bacterium]|nr:YjjG family noncanonical pyrimidine nucleotidase [Clostridia bacterium]
MSKIYTTLLFDADMTLFDFDGAETEAFGIVMAKYGIQYTDADLTRYKAINAALWERFNSGEITKDYLQGARFTQFIATFGDRYASLDGKVLNNAYVEALSECSQLLDGAAEVCRRLSEKYELYIVTNGISRVQHKRFDASVIKPYFKGIFVSEDAGAPKPMKRYFDYVFAAVGEEKRALSVIIGDSLTTDMAGGRTAGIDTVWYNPAHTVNHTDITPTYETANYEELLALFL